MSDFLFEIGTEELPASAVGEALAQLEQAVPAALERAGLDHTGVELLATPRRLTIIASGVPDETRTVETRKKGPPLPRARGEDGSWTPAAEGFARAQGVSTDDLQVEETDRGGYVFAVSRRPGRPATEVLPGVLEELVTSLRFSKSMRWGSGEVRFSRPVRWLLALFDGRVVPFGYAGLESGAVTYGHRYLSQGPLQVAGASAYREVLEGGCVLVDQDARRQRITSLAGEVCSAERLVAVPDEDVLFEVVQLVEWPGAVLGRFAEGHLRLPREVLVHAMESHQRYFPVEDGEGALSAAFVAVHNGDPAHADIIRKGNERVLAARLADAEFFFDEDLKRPLADRRSDLEHVVYQSELGSMAEKSARLEKLVGHAGRSLGTDEEVTARAVRAAALAKCDLVTHMVVEFPDLQGVVGSIYAELNGEEPGVATAIAEQYLPRRLGDSLPVSDEGALLSLAEKADNLAASFGLGHVPTGSEDPYALRRQVLGMLLITTERRMLLDVGGLERAPADELEAEAHGFRLSEDAERAYQDFFEGRERVFFTDRGYRYDLVEAALAVDRDRPYAAMLRLEALETARAEGLLERLYTAFERCSNLSRGHDPAGVDPGAMTEESERALYEAASSAGQTVESAVEALDFPGALGALEPLCEPVDVFFDEVLVMTDDEKTRSNRLSLLVLVVSLFDLVADFRLLAWD